MSASPAPDPGTLPAPSKPADPRVTPFCLSGDQTLVDITTSGGYLWGAYNQVISRVSPTGDITRFPLPATVVGSPLAAGPDGRLWFVDIGDRTVGYMTPAGAVTTFPLTPPPGPIALSDLAVGGDGALWFTVGAGPEFGYGAIGHVTPTGTVTIQPLGTMTLTGMTRAPDGSLWVLDLATVHHLAAGGTDSPLSMPAGWWASGKPAIGPDGVLWFLAEHQGDGRQQLFRLTSGGTFTPISLPGDYNDEASRLTVGPDGNLWMSANLRGSVLRVSPNGTVIEEIAVGGFPEDITVGPDGNIWFTSWLFIGRIAV